MALVVLGAAALCACSTSAETYSVAYAPQFESYDCQKLAKQASFVEVKMRKIRSEQYGANDNIIAMMLMVPLAITNVAFPDGYTTEKQKLQGELDALRAVAKRKNCTILF